MLYASSACWLKCYYGSEETEQCQGESGPLLWAIVVQACKTVCVLSRSHRTEITPGINSLFSEEMKLGWNWAVFILILKSWSWLSGRYKENVLDKCEIETCRTEKMFLLDFCFMNKKIRVASWAFDVTVTHDGIQNVQVHPQALISYLNNTRNRVNLDWFGACLLEKSARGRCV